MNKRFGQNFLISKGGREQIIGEICRDEPEEIWEIGPGIGALTHHLLQKQIELVLFEIDRGFIEILGQLIGDNPRTQIIAGDVLKSWPEFFREHRRIPSVICGNLPYNIGAHTIASLIEGGCISEKMVYTLQKEVVQRICAKPGTKQYSAFTILCAIDYESRHLFDLHPGAFYPKPDVDSAVLVMRKKPYPLIESGSRSEFISFVHTLFSSRRKTAVNNLKNIYGNVGDLLESLGHQRSIRAERLGPQEIGDLFTALKGSETVATRRSGRE
jgi:16S rRNA (adenine1518-N6/adenine1519-N6)-dimethyltransferase